MKLTILGSSPACPNPGGASSGYLVEAPEGHLVIDCGHGVAGFLQRVTALQSVSAIVISHMHPDHFFDLVPLKYGLSFSEVNPIPLYLPPSGTETLDRLGKALDLPEDFWSESFDIHEYDPARPTELAGIMIRFTPTHHFIPAYAMRLAVNGESGVLSYSSDTSPDASVRELIEGSSLALVEATLRDDSKGTVRSGHMTASQAGALARAAAARRLVLTHYWHVLAAELRAAAESSFGGPVELAEQGRTYEV